MGTDMYGWLEVRTDGKWKGVSEVDLMRSYDMFGCLFGVKNYAHFRPIAAERGFPPDLSPETRALAEAECEPGDEVFPTWVSYSELEQIDWDEAAEAPDTRVKEYRRGPDGSLKLMSKALWSAAFAKASSVPMEVGIANNNPPHDSVSWPEGRQWEDGSSVFRVERMVRREVRPELEGLLEEMGRQAADHGSENVRIVVWFS